MLNGKLYIKTYGCQMNVYDSARMVEILAPLGFIASDQPDNADIIILNTCYIREKAVDKAFSELGRLRLLKESRLAAGYAMILVVAGCLSQADGARVLQCAPYVDIVVGPQTYHRLPEMILQLAQAERHVLDLDFPPDPRFNHLLTPTAEEATAFLLVQEGCNKFCTFCVVPYTRGAEYSRPVTAVLADARHLVATGAKEITLIGQNVNAYHGAAPGGGGSWRLGRLLRALAEIDGLRRLRFITSHPCDMDDDLITSFRDLPLLMPYLHLPVQSGSDHILTAMNRGYTVADYHRLVDRLRQAHPDLAISGDFIVGFPSETEKDFSATVNLVRAIGYAQAYSFKFSPRPGTPAATAAHQIPESTKAERLTYLQNLLSVQQNLFNKTFIGQQVPVLLNRRGIRPGQLSGRSPCMQAVTVTAPDNLIGKIVSVHIKQAYINSLEGQLISLS